MSEIIIQQYTSQFNEANGAAYTVLACGEQVRHGTWEGWIEFHPLDERGAILRTDRETTQPDRSALEYWASGLEPLYFEGAFARAHKK
jgi:hypothetical protein